jgi:Protein of unknown function (DUF3500)
MRRTLMLLAVAVLSHFASYAIARADETGLMMADAASRFVAALDANQKSQATFPFDSAERFNWHWIPRERKGLPIKNLTPEQRALAFGLLDTGLSTKGVLKATTIMSLEEILRVQEHGTGPVRDPELYFVSVFGNPGDQGEWGWRIEGHHLSLNYTLRHGKVVSATPFMFGSNPAEVRGGSRKGLRNLATMEGPANKLLLSLNEDQRKEAIVSPEVPDVTTTPNSEQPPTAAPIGISGASLDANQRETLAEFVRAYYENFPESIRADLLDQFVRGAQSLHFAWYGPRDPSKPHAFRIQGPTLLIDFNDKQDGANHIHTFYRSLLGDFGRPLTH